MYIRKVRQVGNSLVISIPWPLLRTIAVTEKDDVLVFTRNDHIEIWKATSPSQIQEKLKEEKGEGGQDDTEN